MNILTVQILLYTLIVGGFLFSALVDFLNLKNIQTTVPAEFRDVYDSEKYLKSQKYLRENTKFGLIQAGFFCVTLVAFIAFGGFNKVDEILRAHIASDIWRGLAYIGILAFLNALIGLPFQIYETFVIEEKYGFNKMNFKTFLGDLLKGLLLGAVLGGVVLGFLLWFFQKFELAWVYAFLFITGFQLFVMFIAPVTIMPLFNKFTPLEDGELKKEIQNFAQKQNFELAGIFKMDGSKRSTKANAYFTGFGKFRRIVLFDTLIEKNSLQELVAVLAHEIGHYKMKHIFRQLAVSILSTAITFYIFSLFMNNEIIFKAFQMTGAPGSHVVHTSIYASFVFFGIFYSPISSLISLYSLHLSRKYEFEADDYAVKTYHQPLALASALKKLSADSLSNLTPHPLKVFLEYTHPPVIERIAKLKAQNI